MPWRRRYRSLIIRLKKQTTPFLDCNRNSEHFSLALKNSAPKTFSIEPFVNTLCKYCECNLVICECVLFCPCTSCGVDVCLRLMLLTLLYDIRIMEWYILSQFHKLSLWLLISVWLIFQNGNKTFVEATDDEEACEGNQVQQTTICSPSSGEENHELWARPPLDGK